MFLRAVGTGGQKKKLPVPTGTWGLLSRGRTG